MTNTIGFAQWIGDKLTKDSWFSYDSKLGKWYVHTKGHLTTLELYKLYLIEKFK